MRTRIGINELRRVQLEILDDVHAFCSSNHISYSLCGGTILGAVRHQGYIPWDDDIDLMMPRSAYERFKAGYKSEQNEIVDLSKLEVCEEQFIKVSRKGTCMEDSILKRRLFGVNIDIFPIDGMPENYAPYVEKLQSIHQRIVRLNPYYKATTSHKFYWFIRYSLKTVFQRDRHNTIQMKQELEKMALAHLPQDSPLSTVIYGDFKVFPFASKMFFDLQNILFEGKEYPCIKETDLYLKTVYGDYMQLPPEEKRISHHLYDSYILN